MARHFGLLACILEISGSGVCILIYQIEVLKHFMLRSYELSFFYHSKRYFWSKYEVYKIQVAHLAFLLPAFFNQNLDISNTHIVEAIDVRLRSEADRLQGELQSEARSSHS